MVQAANATTESREEIKNRIKAKFMQLIETMDQHEIKINEQGGNLVVRQTWDDELGVQLAFGEIKRIEGATPDDFRPYIENWDTIGIESNKNLKRGGKVATDNGVDTILTEVIAPWPVWNRILFITKYVEFDIDGAHLMLTSSDGNQQYLDDPNIYTEDDKKKLVLAHMYANGCLARPVIEDGNIVATNLIFMQQVDVGGSLPTWVQNMEGPKTVRNNMKSAVWWFKREKGLK